MSDKEEVQTMWSESLLEHLYLALRKNKDNAMILELIEELRAKEYDDEFLINKVKMKVGQNEATRLEGLLSGKTVGGSSLTSGEKPLSKADQARANAAAKKKAEQKSGLVGKIKGIFGGS
ncbi:MAG TPA: hypothetical protein EYQ42_04970 [Thiotrichaceae bacterium]|jgi:hypothetical protein|nr:hypothetical protein [Thiotrichaceae bacterium]HIM08631.1 hypothetical protein [Gammaproteobacteria bacterium]